MKHLPSNPQMVKKDLPLFPHSRNKDSISSHAAGDKAQSSKKAEWYRTQIRKIVKMAGPMDNKQIALIIFMENPDLDYTELYHNIARRAPECGLKKIESKDGELDKWVWK